MKPTTLHTLLFTILFSAVSIFSANAQLTYSGGRLSLDTTPIGSYKVSIAGNGAYFKLPSQTNFFQIDISSENTRLGMVIRSLSTTPQRTSITASMC